ncbi:hypothetical protein LSH36_111g05018 [Paralvinella palmiformis]|uniref:Protein FAM177A1 n=1 Tax=Paralvinella palmiformis TaxID=53620 RepID=A0AAD9NC20_9ANNE|nr:hypothetical protein LSH36_111g05018 [Paralvinella palmiformis]
MLLAHCLEVVSDESNVRDPENPPKKKKVPRRILHFSDGILEEYSTDEEFDEGNSVSPVDPKTLPWLPWIWYYVATAAASTLYVADTCGEKLAWFFGITSPKYQYAIDEYNKMKAEDEAEIKVIGEKRQNRELETLSSTEAALDNVPEIAIVDKTETERKF